MSRVRRLLAVGLLLAVPGAPAARCPAKVTTASFLSPRFAVGVRALGLEDTARGTPASGAFPALPSRTLTVEVWYPTRGPADAPVERNAPLSHRGPFPLIVHSPGLLDGRFGEQYLSQLLAARGFVVAAIEFPLTSGTSLAHGGPNLSDLQNQPGDVSFVIDELLRRTRLRGDPLRGAIARRRIGLSGLSLGGATTLLATYHATLRDPRIRAAAVLAPASCFLGEAFYAPADPPLLVMHGDQDLLVPLAFNGARVFERATRSPRTLITLVHGTHTAFAGPVVYPSMTSYDTLGCAAVTIAPTIGNPLDGLGGLDLGIDGTGCALPCTDPLPANPPLQAARQHELTQAAVTAFMEGSLRRSRAGRCFLSERLAAENPDVVVQSAAGGAS